ncbi:MAG: 50S ribosomal protein L25 [Sedimentisphaerales bacterium]|nr:50S ribosomal protein L25 [Sedimentisphaerales bacterium]
MVETLVLKAQRRESKGTRASRRLRTQGQVPAILYGHKEEPVAVTLNYHDLALELQHHHRLLEVELEGKKQQLLLKDVQYDFLGDKIIHVDLARVSLDERVTVTVEVVLKGTPVGVTDGGLLDHILTEVEMECQVTTIPESIKANIANLKIGDSLTAGDLVLPRGADLVTDPSATIATVRIKGEAVEEEEPEEAAETAEPEVISREKTDEEDKS